MPHGNSSRQANELHSLSRRFGYQYRKHKQTLPPVFRHLFAEALRLLQSAAFPINNEPLNEAVAKAPSQHRDLFEVLASFARRDTPSAAPPVYPSFLEATEDTEEETPKGNDKSEEEAAADAAVSPNTARRDSRVENELFPEADGDSADAALPSGGADLVSQLKTARQNTEQENEFFPEAVCDSAAAVAEQNAAQDSEKEEPPQEESGKKAKKKKKKKAKKHEEAEKGAPSPTSEKEADKNGERKETQSTAHLFETFFCQHPDGSSDYRTKVCNLPAARLTTARLTDLAWIELTKAAFRFLPSSLPCEVGGDFVREEVWANLRRWGHPSGHARGVKGHDPDCIVDIIGVAQKAIRAILSNADVVEMLEDYADYLENWVISRDAAPPVSFLDEDRWMDFLEERVQFSTQEEYTCED